MKEFDEQEFIKVCNESESMAQANAKIGWHFNTFKRYAIKLGCYKTNQGGKGIFKPNNNKYLLEDILKGKYPQYQTYKLRNRLIKEGLKENKCEICGLSEWMGKPISIELDHIDGNSHNHLFINLRMLCPNCHSQTETFRAKKRNGVLKKN